MNQGTPRGDDDDDLIRLYHAAADLEGGAPAPKVGDAARAHARVMAAARQRPDTADTPDALDSPVAPAAGGRPDKAANAARWRVSMLGSLAVIGLAGLLVLQFDRGTPQEQDLVRAPGVAAPQPGEAVMPVPAPAPVAESAPAAQEAKASAKATDTAVAAAPAAPPAEPARPGADARSGKAPASMRDRSLQPAPPPTVARARVEADAQADAAAPAMAAPPAAGAAGSSLAGPPANLLAPGARPGAAASDAHGMAAAGDWPALASRLAAGTPVDVRDTLGRTPLMRAAAAGQLDVVRRLLDAGADPRLVDAGGRTAGDWARRVDRIDIASLLDDAQGARDAGR